MEGGEISIATAVAVSIVMILLWWFVEHRKPKQKTLLHFQEKNGSESPSDKNEQKHL